MYFRILKWTFKLFYFISGILAILMVPIIFLGDPDGFEDYFSNSYNTYNTYYGFIFGCSIILLILQFLVYTLGVLFHTAQFLNFIPEAVIHIKIYSVAAISAIGWIYFVQLEFMNFGLIYFIPLVVAGFINFWKLKILEKRNEL